MFFRIFPFHKVLLAGDKRSQLLNADIPGVEEVVVHVPDGFLTTQLCRAGVLWFTLDALLAVFVVLESRLPRLSDILLVLIKNTDASILSYPVLDFSWVDPHGQLTGKYLVQEL